MFHFLHDGSEVTVNLGAVKYWCELEGGGMRLHFDMNSWIEVEEKPLDIRAALMQLSTQGMMVK